MYEELCLSIKPSTPAASVKRTDAQMWSDVGVEWMTHGRDRIWRSYSDQLTRDFVAGWLKNYNSAILKTDLFDEAVSAGIFTTLKDRADIVHGIDVAEQIVTGVAKKYPKLVSRVADVRSLPYEAGTFDAVVSTSTLDHFEDSGEINRALCEIRRVMRTGGRLIVTLDNPLNPKLALRALLPEKLLQKTNVVPYHCGVTLSRDAFVEAVAAANFEVIDTRAFLHCPRASAVKLAVLVDKFMSERGERAFLRGLRWFESLERFPSRWRTGHFSAILAQAV